nr:MAG TPA: hypothetical protein [Caudoviricetes sp.]
MELNIYLFPSKKINIRVNSTGVNAVVFLFNST